MSPASTTVLGVVLLADICQVVHTVDVAPVPVCWQLFHGDYLELVLNHLSSGWFLSMATGSVGICDQASSKSKCSHYVFEKFIIK